MRAEAALRARDRYDVLAVGEEPGECELGPAYNASLSTRSLDRSVALTFKSQAESRYRMSSDCLRPSAREGFRAAGRD